MFTLTDCYDVHLWLLSVGDICAVLKIYCQKYCLQGKIQIMDNAISEMEVEWKFSQSLLERKAVLFQLNNSLSFQFSLGIDFGNVIQNLGVQHHKGTSIVFDTPNLFLSLCQPRPLWKVKPWQSREAAELGCTPYFIHRGLAAAPLWDFSCDMT